MSLLQALWLFLEEYQDIVWISNYKRALEDKLLHFIHNVLNGGVLTTALNSNPNFWLYCLQHFKIATNWIFNKLNIEFKSTTELWATRIFEVPTFNNPGLPSGWPLPNFGEEGKK